VFRDDLADLMAQPGGELDAPNMHLSLHVVRAEAELDPDRGARSGFQESAPTAARTR
jgi:hypothetical protein